jgi:3-oxoacyl-[acyl-carrier protein] reductase
MLRIAAGDMEENLRHAVVTGGGGGLGRALAEALCRPGWVVEAPGRSELDVCDPLAVARFFDPRQVELLVCAAGVTRDAPLGRLGESCWDEVWQVNFRGAARCAEAVLPGMKARKVGHIVLVSSFSALHPPVGQVAYAAAKAALLGLVADLAVRHGGDQIRVNAILPGFLETPMTQGVSEGRRNEVLGDHTLGRFNTCGDTARFVDYLHHQLPHTSGQIFQLDSRPPVR